MNKPLSPTAQAVLDAFTADNYGVCLEGDPERIAAAIRALAESTLPEESSPLMMRGHELERLCERQRLRAEFLAVAAEIENQP
jgi:hypothetical protein